MRAEGGHDDAARWSPIETDEWYAARNATTALRDVLTAAGLERDFPYLRAELNAFGQGLIELGRVAPDTAERLAELLRRALLCTHDAQSVDGPCGRKTD
ncbi:hypothetical protein [Streptomyces silvisoli]|uniref:Uncharacterized protein n=1 Tax=Streptomyces silvisoli TaxID=3034235 RepID=A0ABT5ZWJ3_9ACTN|nr:hypothetical protein [Streptomyces silvisoli]MDF3293393.1 hypothetical protein [Streptomyces silvisoli]